MLNALHLFYSQFSQQTHKTDIVIPTLGMWKLRPVKLKFAQDHKDCKSYAVLLLRSWINALIYKSKRCLGKAAASRPRGLCEQPFYQPAPGSMHQCPSPQVQALEEESCRFQVSSAVLLSRRKGKTNRIKRWNHHLPPPPPPKISISLTHPHSRTHAGIPQRPISN